MKRFIDLRGQGTGMRFAWWDTAKDEFECFNHNYAWGFWGAFAYDYDASSELLRYRELCPKWAFIEAEEDDDDEPDSNIKIREAIARAAMEFYAEIIKENPPNNITITQPGDDKERKKCSCCLIEFSPGEERISICSCDKNLILCRNCYNIMRNNVG